MILPYSRYTQFLESPEYASYCQTLCIPGKHGLRLGQALYNFLDCHKMQQTPLLYNLYNAGTQKAFGIIFGILDYDN